MRLSVVLLVFSAFAFASEPVIVESVEVKGADVHVNLETQVGRPYDEAAVQRDVKYLWGLGKFDDVRAEANGGEVKFIVTSKPRYTVREIRFSPHSYGLHPVFTPGTILAPRYGEEAKLMAVSADGTPVLLTQPIPGGITGNQVSDYWLRITIVDAVAFV